jgi:hypothetical protein
MTSFVAEFRRRLDPASRRTVDRLRTPIAIQAFLDEVPYVGGLFVIEADGYDEAVAIAQSCPHVKSGRIELREIEPTPVPAGA